MSLTSTCVRNVYTKTASEVIGNLDKYYVNIVKSIKTKIKISNMHEFQRFFLYGETQKVNFNLASA